MLVRVLRASVVNHDEGPRHRRPARSSTSSPRPATATTLSVDGHELPRHQPRQAALARRRPPAGRHQARPAALSHARVARILLPHLADRPLFVTRFPDGVTGKSFFQKHWEPAPPFARTVQHPLGAQRARRRLSHLREPRDAALARPDGRARAARLVLAREPGARRGGPEPQASPAPRPRSSARSSTTPTSSSSTSTPTSTRAARAEARSRSCTGARSPGPAPAGAPDPGDPRRPRLRHLHQDLGPDRPAPLSADRARPRLRRGARGGGDDRAARAARAAQGRDGRVGGAPADGQDLLRLQPEQPRQVAGDAVLAAAPSGGARSRCRSRGTSSSGCIRPTSPCTPCPTGWRREGDAWAGMLEARQDSPARSARRGGAPR